MFCPIEGGAGGRRALLVSAEEEAELQLRNREFYAMPVEQEVFYRCFRLPEAEGVQTLFGLGHFHHFAEPLSCGYARHDGGAFRQDDERHGGGTDAYGERKSVQGGCWHNSRPSGRLKGLTGG